jgi:hypothetical protein
MHSLREQQLEFARAVYEGGSALENRVRANGLSGARRLQVYRNSIFAGLTEALRAIYPVIDRLVGGEFFEHTARHFIARHPSITGNLHDFGGEFPEFLATFPEASDLNYLPDVARLEWAYHEVFHAPDHPPLDVASLASVNPADYARLHWRLHPACRLLQSDFPILRIWQVNRDDTECMETVDLAAGGIRLLVIRRGLEVDLETLGPGEHALLRALDDGRNFVAACESTLAVEPKFDVTTCMQWHVTQSTLVDFHL